MVKKEKAHIDLRKEAFRKIEGMHPHKVLLFVSMIGSALIFLFMMIAFTASKPETANFDLFGFPKAFVMSTILFLLSSFAVSKVVPAYSQGNLEQVKQWLGITFLLGLAFACSQIIGWRALSVNDNLFSNQSSTVYLYVISGLHVVHAAGIMIFLMALLLGCHKVSKDGIKRLVYETNPYQKVKFEMLSSFWHFTGILWMTVFVYFYFIL